MSRVQLSTTVDAELLRSAREQRGHATDDALIDEALRALLARQHATEIDASYRVYDAHPIDEPDAWGSLAAFREAAGRS